MFTTDFTGTYDYEKDEALHAARYILDSLYDADISPDELPGVLMKERAHWKKSLRETFDDWDKHFTREIDAGLNHAINGYKTTIGE